MVVNLEKGQRISLDKTAGKTLTQVKLALGWDARKGFLGLFGGGGNIDLDASCVMMDESKNVVDVVYYGHLTSKDASVYHSGDNLTGQGEGDDEVINVNLARVPANVTTLVFTINSYSGDKFKDVENAFCRLVDATNNQEVVRYNLSSAGQNNTAVVVAKVYRKDGEWKFNAIGEFTDGKIVTSITDFIKRVI